MSYELRLGDCLDPVSGLASLPDRSVDHVITDPPYSKNLYSRTRTNKGRMKGGNGRFDDPRRAGLILASGRIGAVDEILEPLAEQFLRVAGRWLVIFSDIEIAHRWRDALGEWYLRTGIWVKTDPMPQITGDRPGQGFEACTIGHRPGRKRWNGGGRAAVWTHGTSKGTSKGSSRPDHPCPKPIGLMRALVADFSDRGEIICDPFAGSGSTGVAALNLGRRFVGWELDAKYFETAKRRLEQTREQTSLLDVDAPKAEQLGLLAE